MPRDYDKEAYPEPPQRTPIVGSKTSLPNPALIAAAVYYYTVDVPITLLRGAIEWVQPKEKSVYYHQKFRRVPDLTECQEGDYVCCYEAEMQWRRDYQVDREIVKVIQDRLGACRVREGHSAKQNCAKEMEQFIEVAKNYQLRYGDLGAYASARKCLMKQKERMMEAQAKSA